MLGREIHDSSPHVSVILRYILARLGQGLLVLFGAALIGFILTNVIGTPADVIGGVFLPEDQREAINARLGYDRPLHVRFAEYLVGAVVGNFGVSYRTNDSAMGMVLGTLPSTLLLVACALVSSTLVALPLAIFSSRKRESRRDRLLRRSIGVLQGTPEFWLALMLILAFSVQLQIFPSFGFSGLSSLVLPTVALAFPIVPTLFRLFRGQLLDVLGRDFVVAMRARGLSEQAIVYHHGLRNILAPAVTLVALLLGYLISGSILIETIFSWPGMGNLTISAVLARDFAVVQAVIIIVAAFYVVLNLAADLIVLISDPRVRRGAP